MIRNLKVLGLALVAIFALVGMGASAASAQFEAEKAETGLAVSANEPQVFKYEEASAANVTCSSVTFDNTVVKGTAATTVTATPTYSNCVGPLGIAASMDFKTSECDYSFSLAKGATTGKTKIECLKAPKTVVVTIGGLCTTSYSPQEIGNVKWTNVGTGSTREVKVDPEILGLDASRSGSPLCGGVTSTTGTYSGSLTLTGFILTPTLVHAPVMVD